LNSSVSYSSIDVNNQYTTNFLKEENSKLVQENEKLKNDLNNQTVEGDVHLKNKKSNGYLQNN